MNAHADHAGHGHGHDHHDDDDGAAHGTLKSYVTGFILAAILTAIPFWLVMDRVFESSRTGRPDRGAHHLFPAHGRQVRKRLEHVGVNIHAGAGRDYAQRIHLDHVSPELQHDAHVDPRHAEYALT